jgi:hypothetical protein
MVAMAVYARMVGLAAVLDGVLARGMAASIQIRNCDLRYTLILLGFDLASARADWAIALKRLLASDEGE